MSNAFAAPHFNDDDAARTLIESIRWPEGPVCNHCGTINHAYPVSGRAGLYRCAEKECRKDFTVTTGTVMERQQDRAAQVDDGLLPHVRQQEGRSARTSSTARLASPISRLGSCAIAFAKPCAMAASRRLAAKAEGIVEADETYYGKTETPRSSKQRGDRPYTRAAHAARATSARSSLLSSAAAMSARSMLPIADKDNVMSIVRDNIAKEVASAHRRKQPLHRRGRALCRRMRR